MGPSPAAANEKLLSNRIGSPPSWRARIALITLGLVLGVLVGEIAARALGFRYRPHMRNRVYFAAPDPDRGWRNRADIAGPYGGDEFLTWVTINEAGQRGPSHPVARTTTKRRVAILGDSQAWGDGVGDDETFAALLDDHETEVLNFAVIGYGTDQQLLSFVQEAAPYAPDVVVVTAYLGNDLRDNVHSGTTQFPKPWFELRQDGSLELRGVPVEHSRILQFGVELYRWAMRYSAVLNALAETTVDKSAPKPGGQEGWHIRGRPMRSLYLSEPTDHDAHALRLTARLLVEIARRVRAEGAQPLVLLLPEHWQVEASNEPAWREELRAHGIDWRRPQKYLRRVLEAENVAVVDALQPLGRVSRGLPGRERTFYPRWKHLTVVGHRAIADLLRPRVRALSPSPAGESRQDGESRQTKSPVGLTYRFGPRGESAGIRKGNASAPDHAVDAARRMAHAEPAVDVEGTVPVDFSCDVEVAVDEKDSGAEYARRGPAANS